MTNKKISKQLITMADADIEMREKAAKDISIWDKTLDELNTKALKKIVVKYGWPTIAMVGSEASHAAWLLVQHADNDAAFQQDCLILMQKLPSTAINVSDIAYLEDRVRVAFGKPQLYGTQFDKLGKDFGPAHVEDIANLDVRRKEVGLSSFKEYSSLMHKYFGDGS